MRPEHGGGASPTAPRIERDGIYGCWRWRGERDPDGYGRLGQARAHRVIWELATNEPLYREQELDHLCRRRDCVRPSHLEVVTRSQNELRKAWRVRVRRKTCAAGHSLWQHGRRTREGGIICRRCDDEQLDRDRLALAMLASVFPD